MKTLLLFLLLILTIDWTATATSIPQPGKRGRPTELARYEMGAYVAKNGTQLRVNIDKQVGGELTVQLIDQYGKLCFDKLIRSWETITRLGLDLTELPDGDYVLKVSNGLEMMVRTINVTTHQPALTTRAITKL